MRFKESAPAWADARRRSSRRAEPPAHGSIEAKRRELSALLEEIRAREPTPRDVARVIAQATEGQLEGPRLDRVAAQVVALFKAAD